MIQVAQQAAEILEKEDIYPEIIDLRTLSPMDRDTVIQSVKKTGRALIVHEAPKTCGLGAEISAFICEEALLSLEAPIMRVTGYDITVPMPKSEDYYFPNPERIQHAVKKMMEF